MTLLFISILPLGALWAMAAPQLKLGNSGYEVISINDQSPEDSVPLAASSSSSVRYNGIGALNLERATDVDDDEAPFFPPQQPKRHRDSGLQHPLLDHRTILESRPNAIDVAKKRLSSPKPKIGTAKSFARSSNSENRAQVAIPIFEETNKNPRPKSEDSDSQEGSSREKFVRKFNRAKNDDRDAIGKSARSSIGNSTEKSEAEGAKFESDFEVADLMGEYKIVSVPAFDLLDEKSLGFDDLSPRNRQKIGAPTVEPGFTLITHFPSGRIHRAKTSLVGHKKSTMFSPIYPSGSEAPSDDTREKSAAVKEIRGKHFWVERKNAKSKKIFRTAPEDETRFLLAREFNEILGGRESEKVHESSKIGHKTTPLLVPSKMFHGHMDPKTEARNFPMSLASPNIRLSHFVNQQPANKMTHLQVGSVPLTIFNSQERWEKIIPGGSIDFARRHQRADDFDREYLDLNRILTGSRVEPPSEIPSPTAQSSSDLAIDIAPDESQESTTVDAKREDVSAEGHEMHDASRAEASAGSPKNSCKQAKPPAPAFYEFLARFTNILLGKSLQYEASVQSRDDGQQELLDDIYTTVP